MPESGPKIDPSQHVDDPIIIWGGGAIGGCMAAFLARAGLAVKMVDLVEEHVHVSRSQGLQIEGPVAQFTQKIDAYTPTELSGQYSCILLAVKAQDTRVALRQLSPHLSQDGVVVSLQNGLSEQWIASELGEGRTIAGFVNFAADYLEPGRIGYGNRGAIKLGEMRPGLTARVEKLARLLQAFDPDTQAVVDVRPYKWGKLAYGSLLFATALANETMTQTLADPEHRPLFVALAREVIGIAARVGVQPVGFDGFDPAAFETNGQITAAAHSLSCMAEHYRHSTKQRSGVWRDLAVRKRKTEIDSQIGEIVRVAHAQGTSTPITQILIRLIHDIEQGRRSIDRSNLIEMAEAVKALPPIE